MSVACLGYAEQAQAHIEGIVRETSKIFPSSIMVALPIAERGIDADLLEIAREQEALAEEQGYPYFLALARCVHGWLLAKGGNDHGVNMLADAHASLRALGVKSHENWALALEADALAWVGRASEAVSRLDEALGLSRVTGISWLDAELQRCQGELMCRLHAKPKVAAQMLGQAMLTARTQCAKLFELRAAVRLAHLYRSQGLGGEARDLLAPIYAWFTEGLHYPHLKEARALLDDLA